MSARSCRRCLFLAAVLAIVLGLQATSDAQVVVSSGSWYGVYQQGNAAGGYYGTPAPSYLSPRPTPAYVGHTYITYPPLAPHNYLHRHTRFYSGRGLRGGRSFSIIHWR